MEVFTSESESEEEELGSVVGAEQQGEPSFPFRPPTKMEFSPSLISTDISSISLSQSMHLLSSSPEIL